jgi:shikimate kinase
MKIFLIGFMGTGKSYWGKLWAEKTGIIFFDLDTLIEQEENKSVWEIFEQNGETDFREMETIMLHKLAAQDNCIIACGGGTPCFNDNMAWMNENGITIHLQSAPGEILKNIMAEKGKRPLLKNFNEPQLRLFIEQKTAERAFIYSQAKIILQTSQLTPGYLSALNLIP